MGLFLQKTNIIRDYLEDICEEPAPRRAAPRPSTRAPHAVRCWGREREARAAAAQDVLAARGVGPLRGAAGRV